MQMYTGTRLTTAIHRRLLSRFFLREGDVCTQATQKNEKNEWEERTWKNSGLTGNRTLTFAMTGRNALSTELIKPAGEQAIVSS